jgi:NAD(P)-dependent dehydrogenase (short-subunit alcohol dehydrogenase family)
MWLLCRIQAHGMGLAAQALAPRGRRVNAVNPGSTGTGWMDDDVPTPAGWMTI